MKRLTYKTLVSEIQVLPEAGRIVLPLLQIGFVPLEACVGVGDEVARGQCIGRADTARGAAAISLRPCSSRRRAASLLQVWAHRPFHVAAGVLFGLFFALMCGPAG